MLGRRKPYTKIGLKRLSCVRCGDPATHQWQSCADGNIWRPVCTACDVKLNLLYLVFMCDPDIDKKIDEYRE